MVDKEALTVRFDKDVFDMVLAMRSNPEWARKSISKIVNDLLRIAMEEQENQAH